MQQNNQQPQQPPTLEQLLRSNVKSQVNEDVIVLLEAASYLLMSGGEVLSLEIDKITSRLDDDRAVSLRDAQRVVRSVRWLRVWLDVVESQMAQFKY
jgi:hypothetical protein